MELTHSFSVPVDRPTAWATFEDIAGVAQCFPGATVTSAEGDSFEGTCKVKLGPVALLYSGSGAFTERDAEGGRLALVAKGRDKRGNGTAGATITATFTEASPQETRVDVVTDLQITGKPAQFGRGVMQDVSDKLLAQFVACLQSRVGPAAVEESSQETSGEGSAEPSGDAVPEAAGAGVAVDADPPVVAAAGGGSADPTSSAASSPAGSGRPRGPDASVAGEADDALDLGATVLPVLLRSYGKQVAAGILVLLVLRVLFRRRS